MSSSEIHSEEEARLDAFLKKEDSLAKLLQTAVQPEPSAELDAAIMKDAEAALAGQAASRTAANDTTFPGAGKRSRLPFVSRWKVPLSLAASALLTLPVIWAWHGAAPQVETAVQLAQAPAAAAAAAAGPQADEAIKENRPTAANTNRNAVRAEAPTVKPETPGRSSSKASQSATMLARRTETSPVSPVDPAREFAPDMIAKADIADPAGTVWRGGPPTLAAPAAAPAPAVVESGKPDAQDRLVVGIAQQPADWLKRIEEKVNSGSRQDALDEWVKFRKAYPDYDVPNRLLAKLNALKQ